MVIEKVTVTNPTGLHCRPLSKVVQKAKGYASRIFICKGDRRYNAKAMISLLQGGICRGDVISVEAEGPDEIEALAALVELINGMTD